MKGMILMFRRNFLFIVFMFFFVGCSSKPVKEVSRKDINCHVDESNFVLKLEDGQIVKYIDSVDGDLGQEVVNILNEEHLQNVSDNDEALRIMNAALSDLNGGCE